MSTPHAAPTIPAWKKKLPMWLTWSRIWICPFLIVLMWYDDPAFRWSASVVFILASMTDWFDGSLARKYDAESNMGKFMDPIADKILVATALILLVHSRHADPVMVILLLARDIFIGGVRSVAAADGVVIAAKAAGKWKTGLQMAGIPAMLIATDDLFGVPALKIGQALLWISVVLSIVSGIQYFRLYLKSRN